MMHFFSVFPICIAYGSEILLMVLTVLLLRDLEKVSPEQLKEDQSYRVRLAGQLRWIGASLVIFLLTTIVEYVIAPAWLQWVFSIGMVGIFFMIYLFLVVRRLITDLRTLERRENVELLHIWYKQSSILRSIAMIFMSIGVLIYIGYCGYFGILFARTGSFYFVGKAWLSTIPYLIVAATFQVFSLVVFWYSIVLDVQRRLAVHRQLPER